MRRLRRVAKLSSTIFASQDSNSVITTGVRDGLPRGTIEWYVAVYAEAHVRGAIHSTTEPSAKDLDEIVDSFRAVPSSRKPPPPEAKAKDEDDEFKTAEEYAANKGVGLLAK